jgi:D-alanyl-D-alanine carboxypeptidase
MNAALRGVAAGVVAAGVVAFGVAVPAGADPRHGGKARATGCRAGQIRRGDRCTSVHRAAHRIVAIAREVKKENDLNAVIVRVDVRGDEVARTAIGHSMTGIPASTRMHFRIGSIAIPYLTTVLLQLQDEGRVRLDDKLAKWFPNLPEARQITLRMLASSTSGYADYVQNNPAFEQALAENVFRQWSQGELLRIAFARPLACPPGTCFNYSHANFIVLGKVLRKVTGKPVGTLIRRRILHPLGLRQTAISAHADIAPPVLHAFARRLPDAAYEDSSFWNPSWSIGRGNIMTSNIDDVAKAASAIGGGRLLSRKAHREQIAPPSIGPPGPSPKLFYGLGLVVANNWVIQNPMLSGYVGLMADLPAKRISIAVESTYGERTAESNHFSALIFGRIGTYLAPDRPPILPP